SSTLPSAASGVRSTTPRPRELAERRRRWLQALIWLRLGLSISYARLLTISRTSEIPVKTGDSPLGCGWKARLSPSRRALRPLIALAHLRHLASVLSTPCTLHSLKLQQHDGL